MELVSSSLCDHIHDRTRIAAVLRVKRVGDHAKFLNTIGGGLHNGKIRELVVAVASVHAVVVRTTTTPIHRTYARFVAAIKEIGSELGLDARLQLQQCVGITLIQGKIVNRILVNNGS